MITACKVGTSPGCKGINDTHDERDHNYHNKQNQGRKR